jgi:hypothetical protein
MMFGYLTLFTALILSLSAAVYSILGLTAIFAAAFWPIVVLGSSLEIGKIVTTLWLHKYWSRAELQYKLYLCSAVIILMVLTSMGVFGFLSKAHLDQAVPSGDIQAQVQIFDDKIQTQKDNIKTARAALTQMDTAVDQVMGRSQDEKGADKAVAIRRSQARERTALQNDISKAQTEITRLQEQRAPVASQARQVEAEVGPIKYIAALIYGDNPEANLLEKAVRWVIILIVIVFDPLALTLLLAATKTFEWERGINILAPKKKDEEVESWFTRARERARFWDKKRVEKTEEPSTFISTLDNSEPVVDRQPNTDAENEYFEPSTPKYEPDDGPLTDEQIAQLKEMAKADLPVGKVVAKQSLFQEPEIPDQEPIKKPSVLAGLDSMWSRAKRLVVKDTEAEHAPLNFEHTETETEQERKDKTMIRAWKEQNPNDTIKHQERLLQSGFIDQLPWQDTDFQSTVLTQMQLQADNTPPNATGEMRGFGTAFPPTAIKGDMFLRVDQLPSVLYKFNGNIWIEVDKSLSDQHAYDEAYIDHLIEKISTGEYDSELLSDAERDSIEQRLNKTPGTV